MTKFGVRITGTNLLFWGPDHLRRFKPWPDSARTFSTPDEAKAQAEKIAETNTRLNKEFPHLGKLPVRFEVVRIVTQVLPLENLAPATTFPKLTRGSIGKHSFNPGILPDYVLRNLDESH